jgi:hypothetical protein
MYNVAHRVNNKILGTSKFDEGRSHVKCSYQEKQNQRDIGKIWEIFGYV